MRGSIYVLFIALLAGTVMAQQPPVTTTTPIYTALPTDVQPQLRNNRTFVPVRVISQQFGATVSWAPATSTVTLQQAGQPNIVLIIGSRTARVGTTTVTLDAAPFIELGRTMVPLRFIAESYGAPVAYNAPTNSVYVYRGDRVYVLPLISMRTGIVIANPRPGELVRNPILVQGQGNVFEGSLVIEVQDMGGRVIARSQATAGMGGFYPFSTRVNYNMPTEDAVPGRIVVYSQDGRGNGQILARTSVDVTLASTQ